MRKSKSSKLAFPLLQQSPYQYLLISYWMAYQYVTIKTLKGPRRFDKICQAADKTCRTNSTLPKGCPQGSRWRTGHGHPAPLTGPFDNRFAFGPNSHACNVTQL